jgi:PAS domain S-box-containing protein
MAGFPFKQSPRLRALCFSALPSCVFNLAAAVGNMNAYVTADMEHTRSGMDDSNKPGIAGIPEAGEIQLLIDSIDWSAHPLGPPASWSQSLRTALSICMGSAGVCALYWGPQFHTLYNGAYAKALAERHPWAFGRPVHEVWAEISDVLIPQLKSVIESGKGFATQQQRLVMHRHGRDEETFWVYNFIPVTGEDGSVAGVFVTAVEITAQLTAENDAAASRKALREMNDSLAQQVADRTADRNGLWQLSSHLMLITKFDGVMTSVNPAWTEILGWELSELTGKNFFDLIHPDDLVRTTEAARSISEDRITLLRFQNRYRHRDGSYRWITWTAAPSTETIVAVGRDDTAEKKREDELAQAQEQLRQSQKMEAVGQLTGGLAHDFNNLLQAMMSNLELLQARVNRARFDDLDRFIHGAQGAGRRAAALTQRLLAFSRRQTLDPRPTDVNRLINGIEELLRRTVGPQIVITVSQANTLWTALVDEAQMESSLLNLCINARDAMSDGGILAIATTNIILDERTAKDHAISPGEYLSITVTDDGIGMSPQTLERAFEPFFTTKPLGEGTGLGLSMIYGFARQSNGYVRISSEVGRGTTVELCIPRYQGEMTALDVKDLTSPAEIAKGQTILIVDDEITIRTIIEEVLSEAGYTVLTASEGGVALEVLRANKNVDLLVTDVGLPGLNGRQVADAARTLNPNLKVLFITGYVGSAVFGKAQLEPGMELLTKPFDLNDLSAKISKNAN